MRKRPPAADGTLNGSFFSHGKSSDCKGSLRGGKAFKKTSPLEGKKPGGQGRKNAQIKAQARLIQAMGQKNYAEGGVQKHSPGAFGGDAFYKGAELDLGNNGANSGKERACPESSLSSQFMQLSCPLEAGYDTLKTGMVFQTPKGEGAFKGEEDPKSLILRGAEGQSSLKRGADEGQTFSSKGSLSESFQAFSSSAISSHDQDSAEFPLSHCSEGAGRETSFAYCPENQEMLQPPIFPYRGGGNRMVPDERPAATPSSALFQPRFLQSSLEPHQWPGALVPEVAFWGRSNVGKSSLLNALFKCNLARTSKAPGRTQSLNFYHYMAGLMLVDVPGYGYAKVPEALKSQWDRCVGHYFVKRPSLWHVYLLLDARRLPSRSDIQAMSFLADARKRFSIVFTKIDAIAPKMVEAQTKELQRIFRVTKKLLQVFPSVKSLRGPAVFPESSPIFPVPVFFLSARHGKGIGALQGSIKEQFALWTPPSETETCHDAKDGASVSPSVPHSHPHAFCHTDDALCTSPFSKKELKKTADPPDSPLLTL